MNGQGAIAADQTYALVVGIEAYPRRQGLDLQGPAADALRLAEWLCQRGVPAGNIKILISSRQPVAVPDSLQGAELFQGVVNQDVLSSALESFRRSRGRLLFVFWTGHGIMTADQVRRPLLANYSDTDTHNLNIESLQEHLRSSIYLYPPYQVIVFDMCATLFDERLRRETLSDHRFHCGPARLDCRQFLLYAAADRQVAENLATEGTGLYFKELMPILEQQPDWPPDMLRVVGQLEARFDELRRSGLTSQEPIYQHWRAPTGRAETTYLGARTAGHRARQWMLIFLLCLAPSFLLSEFGLGIAPPWPNRWVIALATVPIPLVVYYGVSHWCASKSRERIERLLRWSLAAALAAGVIYLLLFVQLTFSLPDHWHREVGGFTYTKKAAAYREHNPGIPDRDLIRDMGNDVEKVFGGTSLAVARMAFLLSWLALFVSTSSLASTFLIVRGRARIPEATAG